MNTFMGFRVLESSLVMPVPKIQVRDIKWKDGTSILSQESLAKHNRWWLERFGTKEVAYMFSGPFGNGVFMSPKNAAMLKNFT